MFSPYYAAARRRLGAGHADPLNHCAVNVALYRRGERGQGGVNRWAMTERGRGQVARSPSSLQIGPSALRWDGATLHVHIDEVTVPWPSRLRGVVRLHADRLFDHPVSLSATGHHRWCPIAPSARVEVDFDRPGLGWSGAGYLDSNVGDAPLEQAFKRWDWSRAHLSGGRSAVFYDVEPRGGEAPGQHRGDVQRLALGLAFGADGSVAPFTPPPAAALPPTKWRLARGTRSEAGAEAHVAQTLEDAPFYARSLLTLPVLGERVTAMHESLSLERFDNRWVQAMLPFRMPRIVRHAG